MKLAISTINGEFSAHFGGSTHFAFYNVDGTNVEKLPVVEAPEHQPGLLPVWLQQQGTEVVIAGGMGGRACQLLEQAGIQFIVGVRSQSPDELAQLFAQGQLTSTGETCAGHDHHGQGHHHH